MSSPTPKFGLFREPTICIIGDGPHSREVAELITLVLGRNSRSVSPDQQAQLLQGSMFVLGIGKPDRRVSALNTLGKRGTFVTLIHPSARISPSATIGIGTVLSSGATISSDASLGDGVLMNWNSTVGHDAVLGCGTVINPSAAVSGGVVTGIGCLIGAGAVVLEGLTLGDYSIVGAGAVVTKNVPEFTVVLGIPAAPSEELSKRHLDNLRNS